ncbi:TetR/AcrR family transcriptional regulator [Sphingomonas sp. PAMC26645]|uniref:TetR/AcrR family transcriptional regulator n=1 Tax=Sphingomonas sp. PAMC26645 TaxID=2565555 RepID=UPI00109E319F|nr:TetR/AcrR family transcriptional regulator [Sphingomonas sp. PAMC26645]QCB41512.1 TetR/AcrR family transcriptional regulator [Sphingomonas sp. PAMC26645]
MARDKTRENIAIRGEPVRQRVIDAAERLLRSGKADFSMRDLAAEAGVSFATPFNHFGSKGAIMHALSERRTDTMAMRFAEARLPTDAASRVLLAVDTAVAVMLEEPGVNRAVMSWIGTTGGSAGQAWARSTALWTLALGAGEGIPENCRTYALDCLPRQLALGFRGALSFWSAGELPDEALGPDARAVASTLLLGFTEPSMSFG